VGGVGWVGGRRDVRSTCSKDAIRRLMHEAALAAKLDPDRLSFTRTLRVARRTTSSKPGFSP